MTLCGVGIKCSGADAWGEGRVPGPDAAHQLIGQRALEILTAPLLGDLNGDGQVNVDDVNPLVQALSDRAAYESNGYPVDVDLVGDLNGDGRFDLGDIGPFSALLAPTGAGSGQAIPEPSGLTLVLFVLLAAMGSRPRRPAQ